MDEEEDECELVVFVLIAVEAEALPVVLDNVGEGLFAEDRLLLLIMALLYHLEVIISAAIEKK